MTAVGGAAVVVQRLPVWQYCQGITWKPTASQRLKAAVHYTVGQICEDNAQGHDVQFTKQFIAALTETTFKYTTTVATDLEAFAKHGKRSTINCDDVKLMARKSGELHEHMSKMAAQLTAIHEKRAKAKPRGRNKKSTAAATNPAVSDEDSNM